MATFVQNNAEPTPFKKYQVTFKSKLKNINKFINFSNLNLVPDITNLW